MDERYLSSMANNRKESESAVAALKSESARQRWEMFHRAIAHAKEYNNASLAETETHGGDANGAGPLLTIIR
ncbi:MAG: hypothetical protein WBM80_09925 [Woeseiaceae bacterium]